MGDTKTIFDLQNGIFSPFSKQDRNRTRRVAFYGRVSTEHEAQLAALEKQIQWYDDQARSHNNWIIVDKYIDGKRSIKPRGKQKHLPPVRTAGAK